MQNMYNHFRGEINRGGYDLTEMLDRLTVVFATGGLTAEQLEELRGIAGEKADPVASLAPIEDRFDVILQKFDALEARVAALESASTEPVDPGEEPEEPAAETYPEWTQPLGAHDAYKIGDRVTFNGKVYESVINANVWSPAVYPAGWKEVVEQEAEVNE